MKEASFKAKHGHGTFWEEDEAIKAFSKVENAKEATVTKVEKEEKKDYPPNPFNTTQFLLDANRQGISPSRAMSIAESLYTEGWISYPRTDNTVYPKSLPIKSIVQELLHSDLAKEAGMILSQDRIIPTKGMKETTDHPPIHPVTGAKRSQLAGEKWTIYELVVRRFLATLAPSAIVHTTSAELDIEGEKFKADGKTTVERGWYDIYIYYKPKDTFIPDLVKGEKIPVQKMNNRKSETKPPNRFNQGSIIREMEKLGLGTKSTRHEIVQKLYDRRYIEGTLLQPTTTGKALIEALEESAEKITQHEMTSLLEEDMEQVALGKKTMEEVIDESKKMLVQSLKTLEKNKDKVRKGIKDALSKQSFIGDCPKCGGQLMIRWSKRGKRFVGCSGYPGCNNTYPLPQSGLILPHEEKCDRCGTPAIKFIQKRRKPLKLCLDLDCQMKENNKKGSK